MWSVAAFGQPKITELEIYFRVTFLLGSCAKQQLIAAKERYEYGLCVCCMRYLFMYNILS